MNPTSTTARKTFFFIEKPAPSSCSTQNQPAANGHEDFTKPDPQQPTQFATMRPSAIKL
jgi:hypothetical protein